MKSFLNAHKKLLALCLCLIIVVSAYKPARAIIGEDIPLLTQILGAGIKETLQLTALLSQSAMLVTQVKEYASLAKTVYYAIDELRHMTWDDFKGYVKEGLARAFPEVQQIYRDIHDIKDLHYISYTAQMTLRGMLWEHVYGPALEFLPDGNNRLEVVTDMAEYRTRAQIINDLDKKQGEQWAQDAQKGNGAALSASQHAQIKQVMQLAQLHETTLGIHTAAQKTLEHHDRNDSARIAMFERWMHDLGAFMVHASGNSESCTAGRCLYESYGATVYQKIAQYQQEQKNAYDNTLKAQ